MSYPSLVRSRIAIYDKHTSAGDKINDDTYVPSSHWEFASATTLWGHVEPFTSLHTTNLRRVG